MKKCLLMVLCLVMMASVALAGTMPMELKQLSEGVTLVYVQPEGVRSIEARELSDLKILTYEMEDENMPVYVLTIAHSELLDGMDITELPEEMIETLVIYTAFDSQEHSYEVLEMEDGWPAVLIVYEGESDWVDAFTVIEGYVIQMHGYHTDFRPLTKEEDRMAFTLLDSVNIVRTDEETGDEAPVGMPNPMIEAEADDFAAVAGFEPALPEGAKNVAYFAFDVDSPLVEVQFEDGGIEYVLRAQPGEQADISGIYDSFAQEQQADIGGVEGTVKLNEGGMGVCLWYAEPDINFSLSASEGATVDGLAALAAQLVAGK